MPAKVNINDLPEELRAFLGQLLGQEDGKRPRAKRPGLKERKVKAIGTILQILSEFTVPEQRAILRLTNETLAKANKAFWRSNKTE